MKKQNKRYFFSGIILAIILLITSICIISIKHSSDKAKAQAASEAQKIQETRKEEEKKKLEEEKKKLQDNIKIQKAVDGEGTSRNIPVLMYHSIDYEKGNALRIPKDKFRLQMKYLKDNGFTPITLDELYSNIVFGADLPAKPIVLTLDDGYVDNYTNALPVLKEFNFKATVFMVTSCIDTDKRCLTSDQLKEMDKSGMDIESHTVSHPELNTLSYDEQLTELKVSKAVLEKLLGKEIKYIAYPYGKFNKDTLKLVDELGYKMAFSTITGSSNISNGLYKLHRFYVSNDYNMDYFKKLVNLTNK